ncbi:WD40 repeat domain-containing protein [Nocardia panacis]|uniref:WD40 repeat domain-containing protein n=1 Tax=Nocardia panacis TaxID=2340916 RepID=A0A3A4JTJ5_9NOCA|nr:WD40 repeat domain-containing protein [Nocardia panacis]RJO73326.1 WD40 repeat domain-containing protein [Nocardia panacis]
MRLGTLRDVEHGLPPELRLDEEAGEGFAYFFNGATAVACPPDLHWLVVCAAAEAHHNGGDIVVWGTSTEVGSTMLQDGGDFFDDAFDVQLSPDSGVAAAWKEGVLYAWRVPEGKPLWQAEIGTTRDPFEYDDDDDSDVEPEDELARIGFSGDGRRIAASSVVDGVHVIDAATGAVVFASGAGSFGPVALDHHGERLAHAASSGEIIVREVNSGAIVLRYDTGLAVVNALTYAPDGAGLLVAGGRRPGESVGATATVEAAPTAIVLDIGGDAVIGARQIQPVGLPASISAASVVAAGCTRVIWADHGPMIFAASDHGAALFDGDGRILWTGPSLTIGNFTADGRTLVLINQSVDLDATIDAILIDDLR